MHENGSHIIEVTTILDTIAIFNCDANTNCGVSNSIGGNGSTCPSMYNTQTRAVVSGGKCGTRLRHY